MTLATRVIPCLDVDDGRVVKGVNFVNLRDAGDPVELAERYDREGADELTFLDVTASSSGRSTMIDVVKRTADQVFIPLTVGGGIRTVDDVDTMLRAGADKVSVNTAAIARPEVLAEMSRRFGSQCIVLSVDARTVPEGAEPTPSGWEVTTHGGRTGTGIDAVEWAVRGQDLGVGEILLNSMDADGTKQGFDLRMLTAVRAAVSVPVIASGGAGRIDDFAPAVQAELPGRTEEAREKLKDFGLEAQVAMRHAVVFLAESASKGAGGAAAILQEGARQAGTLAERLRQETAVSVTQPQTSSDDKAPSDAT